MDKVEQADVAEARRQKVSQVIEMVKADIAYWDYAFKRMRKWRDFARGLQWPKSTKNDLGDADREYVANITMRHLKQRTASIYAKNPTYVWRKSRRLTRAFWDGSAAQLQMAQMMIQSGADATGYWQGVLMDAMQSRAEDQVRDRVGETLRELYSYFIREQTPPTKLMMKKQVLTSLTCGVAYIKQTFQRATDYPPDTSRAIADGMAQLAKLERLSAEMADGDVDPYSAEMEELRLMLQALEGKEKIILREGLALDYPDSLNIIPDRNLVYLPGFVGCGHVTEQYELTPEAVKEVYGVDLQSNFTEYKDDRADAEIRIGSNGKATSGGAAARTMARVWEVWDRQDNLVYTVCDGYHDFLEEPHEPEVYTERFWPWFVYAPNAVDDADDPFPPSDVELIMPMQMEINRAGEARRQHRYAARPGWVSGTSIPEDDRTKIESRGAHSIIVLSSLGPEEDIRAKLQPFPTSQIDQNLYETGSVFADLLRSVGTQEANLGGASGATATETSIAESSRQSTLGSAIDEFDDLLTEMARAGGQILLQEMSEAEVKKIVGRGAVWPEATRKEIAQELFLEVKAGSSGRPNQAQEVAIMERLFPLLFQIPGIKHEKLMQHGVRVLDDGSSYEDWVDMDALPIMALNGQMQAAANNGSPNDEPAAQGAQGAANAPQPPQPQGEGMPRPGQQGFGSGGAQ